MPDEIDLAAIRQRAELATPGPWYVGPEHPQHGDVLHEYELVISDATPIVELEPSRNGSADAAFIAHARQDVPALLAEIDRLRRIEEAAVAYYRSGGDVDDHNELMDVVRADDVALNARPYAEDEADR